MKFLTDVNASGALAQWLIDQAKKIRIRTPLRIVRNQ